MNKRLICLILVATIITGSLPIRVSAEGGIRCAIDMPEYEANDIWDYDPCFTDVICVNNAGNASADLTNVPDPWNTLISNVASQYPDTDPRLVAATLYVENRGWPDYNRDWAVSSASAAGPWQFIPSSWASMGHDGDGDGIKDPNNPKDAVHAAYKHLAGSAGQVLIEGYTGDIDAGWQLVFRRDRTNLLSHMASYNGSGAPDGVALSDFPRNENSDYVRMAYYLIASDFTLTWSEITGEPISVADGVPVANASGDISAAIYSGTICPSGTDVFGVVNSEGFAFPVGGVPKNQLNNNKGVWPCPNDCHHDGSGAFDISDKRATAGSDQFIVGKPVYAIEDLVVDNISNVYLGEVGCQSFSLTGKSGWKYWYGHISNASISLGQSIKAGQQIAEVGERRCTGNGSYPHLHIDRGPTKGAPGGNQGSNASRSLVPIINKLYEELNS